MTWREKWGEVIRKGIRENFGLKALSLGLAFLLWLTVLGEQKAEVVLNIPVELGKVPNGMMVVNPPVDYVAVKVRGPKSLVMALAPNEIHLGTARVRLHQGRNLVTLSPREVEVPRGVAVLSVSPARLKVRVERVEERRLRVIPKLRGKPASGYLLGEVTVKPRQIKVEGPQKEVRRLTRAHTLPIDIAGRAEDLTINAFLEPLGKNIRILDGEAISVTVQIKKKERG
ncbi:MAG: YbbR-like domain-containing protein [Candidatus Methylomirabilales bacterium]